MLKRASLSRAIALDPELLFLDEPTSGLDPASAAGVDELIRRMHALYGLTIVLVTHDLDLLWQVCDRVAVLGEAPGAGDRLDGRVVAIWTTRSSADTSTIRAPARPANALRRNRTGTAWKTRSTSRWSASSCSRSAPR